MDGTTPPAPCVGVWIRTRPTLSVPVGRTVVVWVTRPEYPTETVMKEKGVVAGPAVVVGEEESVP